MTGEELVQAVNDSGLTKSQLTALLKQGKNTIEIAKLQAELGGIERQRDRTLNETEQAKQAKQAEIAAAQQRAAVDFGVVTEG